jgi:GT2 family glycosyltransferase
MRYQDYFYIFEKKTMLSIITSIYNQRSMNELFYNSLCKHTNSKFELIIIDNGSTDGSFDFFSSKPNVKVHRNDGNYNYPYCQNIGIELSNYDILCFFNNDIILTPNWDDHILAVLEQEKGQNIISVSSNDHVENKREQKKISRKWKRIKYPIQAIFGNRKFSLRLMESLMYGNLNKYAEDRFRKFGLKLIEGYSGSAIIAKKDFLLEIGKWDERIQSADFDLFNKVKEKSLYNNNIKPIKLVLGVYFHHYQRLTVKTKYPPFVNCKKMISLDEKWGKKTSVLRKNIVG